MQSGATFEVLLLSNYAFSPIMLPTVRNISGTPVVE
jgi:hypothetical protein